MDGYAFGSVDGPTCRETSFRLVLTLSVSAVVQSFSGAWSLSVSSTG